MFSERLKYLRGKLGLSQDALAKKLNLPQQTYGHWETGRSQPDQETLILLAKFFNVSIDYLLGYSQQPLVSNTIQISAEDLELLQKIKNLPADRREIVDTVIKVSDTSVIKKASSEK